MRPGGPSSPTPCASSASPDRELLNEWVGHDLMHTVQAERALMQPFVAQSGSWRSYFADHDVEAPGRR
jgi:hypothetical protein